MIEFGAFLIVTFHACSSLELIANQTFLLETFLIDVLDTLDVDGGVLLLEVAFGHPDGAHVVDPDVVALGFICGVGRFGEVVVEGLIIGCYFLVDVLLFVLECRALLGELMEFGVSISENRVRDMD